MPDILPSAVFMHGMRANRIAQGLTQRELAQRVRDYGYDVPDGKLATSEVGWKGWRLADSEEFRTAVAHALGVSRVFLLATRVPTPCLYCPNRGRSDQPCEACGYLQVRPCS